MIKPILRPLLAAMLAAMTAGVAWSAEAETSLIFRCVSAAGKVSYSDSPCPKGVRAGSVLDRKPTLVVADGERPGAASARAAGQLVPGRRAALDPIAEDRRITEQIALQRRACEDLDGRIAFLRRDLAAAASGRAASVELELRRLEDQHQLNCPRP